MFIDGSSAHVRKVKAGCPLVGERESLLRDTASPCIRLHQDLLLRRVTVFEVAKRCSRYFQRHLTSYAGWEILLLWTHTETSGMINVCLGQRTNKQRLKASSKRSCLFPSLSRALSLNSANDTAIVGFCMLYLPPSLSFSPQVLLARLIWHRVHLLVSIIGIFSFIIKIIIARSKTL